MKKIEVFVKPFKLEEVKDALTDAGITHVRLMQAQVSTGELRQEIYQGTEYNVDLDSRVLLMTMVEDSKVDSVVELIERAATTGHPDDGKIIVTPVEQIIAINGKED